MRTDREHLLAARACGRLGKIVELALDGAGLTPREYRALAFLGSGPAAASAVAGSLSVTLSSITAIGDALVERGHIHRVTDPNDRRRVLLSLTPDGRKLLARGDRTLASHLGEIIDTLPAQSRAEATHGLALLDEALDAYFTTEPE
jgi:DNA-binding MarR family transcriptional regulator